MRVLAFLIPLGLTFGQTLTLNVTPSQIRPGGSAVVTMTYADANPTSNLSGVEWTGQFPAQAALTVAAPTPGPIVAGGSKDFQCGGAQGQTCITIGLNTNVLGNGTLATYNVVSGISAAAGTYPIAASNVFFSTTGTTIPSNPPVLGVDGNGNALNVVIVPANITILSKYDLNSDGIVNSADYAIALDQATNKKTCGSADVNGDGKCNISDVLLVILASLGRIPL